MVPFGVETSILHENSDSLVPNREARVLWQSGYLDSACRCPTIAYLVSIGGTERCDGPT